VASIDQSHNTRLAINEGWCARTRPVFNDHLILVGPKSDPVHIASMDTLAEALRALVASPSVKNRPRQILFHSCGDGSATFYNKIELWLSAGIDTSSVEWSKAYAADPFDALMKAGREEAYIMTQRSTYLVAKDRGLVPEIRVSIEEDPALVVPCSVVMNTKAAAHSSDAISSARQFAEWLSSDQPQQIIAAFGRDLNYSRPPALDCNGARFRSRRATEGQSITISSKAAALGQSREERKEH